PHTPLGQSALRLLHRVLEGFRICLPPQVAIEMRLGEMVEAGWDARPTPADPLVGRLLVEAQRYLRRLPAAGKLLAGESADQEAFLWQASRLESLEPALREYLQEAAREMSTQLATVRGEPFEQTLQALCDLRAEAAPQLLPIATKLPFDRLEGTLEALT